MQSLGADFLVSVLGHGMKLQRSLSSGFYFSIVIHNYKSWVNSG